MVDNADPLLGLGGSAYLQRVHGLKTGAPPRCDLEKSVNCTTHCAGLSFQASSKSAHDCSDGGLAVALAESCISQQIARDTPRLIGAQIDLSAFAGLRPDALLFGETQGRAVISVAARKRRQSPGARPDHGIKRGQTRHRRWPGPVNQNCRNGIQVAGDRTARLVVERDCAGDGVSATAERCPASRSWKASKLTPEQEWLIKAGLKQPGDDEGIAFLLRHTRANDKPSHSAD